MGREFDHGAHTAGGKMQPVALYHMSSAPAAAPCAAASGTLPDSSDRIVAPIVAQPVVPRKNPLGLGGSAPAKKMIPLAIIGGMSSLVPRRASSAPASVNDAARPTPARTVSTSLSSWGNFHMATGG